MPPVSENGLSLAIIQPFGNDICESWHEAKTSAPIHDEALDALRSLEAEGRVTLLSAPRAGHGKTHLLGRVAAGLQRSSLVAALPWQHREGLKWSISARGVLQDLAIQSRSGPVIQEACAGVLAALLSKMVQSGQVPSANPQQVMRLLRDHPLQLFSQDGEAKPLRNWFHAHFKTLRKRLAVISHLPDTLGVEAWLQRFMDAATLIPEEGLPLLSRGLHGNQAEQSAETFFHLITLWKPLVLVADHMDGLYRDAEAGMEVARMALSLTSLPRIRVVLSVNQDLWDTTLGRQLPTAMQDRLSARSVALRGMGVPEAQALLELRLRDAHVKPLDAFTFLQFIDLEGFFASRTQSSVTPRELLRYASRSWYRWLHPAPATAAPPAPADSVTPELVPSISAGDTEIGLSEVDLERLTRSLKEDESGQSIDLSAYTGKMEEPPVGVVPLPKEKELPWQGSFLLDDDEPDRREEQSPSPPLLQPAAAPQATPAPTSHLPSPLLRLGEMIARLQKRHTPTPEPTSASTSSPQASESTSPPPASPVKTPQAPSELLDLFEELRAKADPSKLDANALRDILRLAGERSAWIQHQEAEIPGLSGQTIPCWTWPGMETVFGIAPLHQTEDWQLLSSYIAGRLAEFANSATQYGEPSPHLKLVVFTPEASQETNGLRLLFAQGILPLSLEPYIDEVHLTEPQQTDLLALRELAHEPSLASDPTMHHAWQILLAERLEFFWRRLTRPLRASAS